MLTWSKTRPFARNYARLLNVMPCMSEDQSDREWRFYIEDMTGFCERVQNFTRDITREEFLTEPMRYDATVRNIELIS